MTRAELALRVNALQREEASPVRLSAAEAVLQGEGLTMEGAAADLVYSPDIGAILNIAADGTASYTVPESVSGDYDFYFEVGRSVYTFGSTPFRLLINDEAQPVFPIPLESVATEDYSDIFDMGLMQIAVSRTLKAGDTLTIRAQQGYGVSAPGYSVNFLPAIGDVVLYPAGAKVPVGYQGGTVPVSATEDPADPLSGLQIAWLGSSVTYGMQSGGWSMADEIAARHPGTRSWKYAISGTTLVNDSVTSYVSRMKEIDPDLPLDLFVVQLSTNDAADGKPLGTLTESMDPADFDDKPGDLGLPGCVLYRRPL